MGWDAGYRSKENDILFSGDITDAQTKKGASELFYVQRQHKQDLIVFVNYYNYDKDAKLDVPFKIMVAKEQTSNFTKNYMIDPNNVVAIAKSNINQRQKILGLLVTTTSESRFYFSETYLGRSITSSSSAFVKNSRKYLFAFYENTIGLNDILLKAGAKTQSDSMIFC